VLFNCVSGLISPEEFRYGIRKSLVKSVGQHRHEYFGWQGLLDPEREEERKMSIYTSSAIAASLTMLANVGPQVDTYNANLLPRCRLTASCSHSSETVFLPLLLTPPTFRVHWEHDNRCPAYRAISAVIRTSVLVSRFLVIEFVTVINMEILIWEWPILIYKNGYRRIAKCRDVEHHWQY